MAELLTLNVIRAQVPCESGWRKLLEHLGKTGGDDEPLSMLTVLESNGFNDALWCLCCVSASDGAVRLLACEYAQAVAQLSTDSRVQAAIDTARRYAHGDATDAEMAAARDAALAAAEAVRQDAGRSWARDGALILKMDAKMAAAEAARGAAHDVARHAVRNAVEAAADAAAAGAAYAAESGVAWGLADDAITIILRRWIIEQEAA